MKWEVLNKPKIKDKELTADEVVDILLTNRGIKTKKQKEEFFKPTPPSSIEPKDIGLNKSQINKAIRRIEQAKKAEEHVVVYGDYDTDGVCATAILWETLYASGVKALPYIPDRFSEGYGLSIGVINKIASETPKVTLIITVDNGIVAHEAVKEAKKHGVDVIVTDHHQKDRKLLRALSVVHTTEISGAALAWIFAREVRNKLKTGDSKLPNGDGLELAAIGTVADMLPLTGANRSIVKYGIKALNKTKRLGLLSLFRDTSLVIGEIGTYQIGWVISPRINAMGRLEHAIDSLRLLCTRNTKRAYELAKYLSKTNKKRQDIVGEIVVHAEKAAATKKEKGAIVISHATYHEGIIGLAASKLVEKFYLPSIVISKGKKISKASARSIFGFNMVQAIRKLDGLTEGGGGHKMAAGFTISTSNIQKFEKKFLEIASTVLTKELLERSLKIDLGIEFGQITKMLINSIEKFAPTGVGNPTPTFSTNDVVVIDVKTVGKENRHLKMKLEKNGRVFDAIAFGMGYLAQKINKGGKINAAYNLEENEWNGNTTLQLKVKDVELP